MVTGDKGSPSLFLFRLWFAQLDVGNQNEGNGLVPPRIAKMLAAGRVQPGVPPDSPKSPRRYRCTDEFLAWQQDASLTGLFFSTENYNLLLGRIKQLPDFISIDL